MSSLPQPGPPEPPEAPPYVPQPDAPSTITAAQVTVVLGALAVVVSMFLDWLDFSLTVAGRTTGSTATASDVPVQFLFDYTSSADEPTMLVLLIPAVMIGVVGAVFRNKPITLIGAGVSLFVAAMYTFQLQQTVDPINAATRGQFHLDVGDLIGVAPFVCAAGAIAMVVGGILLKPLGATTSSVVTPPVA